MNRYRTDPPIQVGHRTLVVVVSSEVIALTSRAGAFFAGAKQPMAVICRTDGHEEIFDVAGQPMDKARLRALTGNQLV